MAPKFETSGLRGLVVDLTTDVVADYIRAVLAACSVGAEIFVWRDLRPSSHALADCVIAAARSEGINVKDCGAVPTPALALAAIKAGAGAVMVNGSHIPAYRNGLKFYLATGEISKAARSRSWRRLAVRYGKGMVRSRIGRIAVNYGARVLWQLLALRRWRR